MHPSDLLQEVDAYVNARGYKNSAIPLLSVWGNVRHNEGEAAAGQPIFGAEADDAGKADQV